MPQALPFQVVDLSSQVLTFRPVKCGEDTRLQSLDGQWSIAYDAYAQQWVAKCHVQDIAETVCTRDDIHETLRVVRTLALADEWLLMGGPETMN
jgi:hypothetical protein